MFSCKGQLANVSITITTYANFFNTCYCKNGCILHCVKGRLPGKKAFVIAKADIMLTKHLSQADII